MQETKKKEKKNTFADVRANEQINRMHFSRFVLAFHSNCKISKSIRTVNIFERVARERKEESIEEFVFAIPYERGDRIWT